MKSHVTRAVMPGLAGGIAMLAVLIVGATSAGLDWDAPLRWIAALLMSEPALILAGQARGGMSPTALVILALAIHLVISVALAGAFLLITGSVSGWRRLLAGVVFGAAIWAAMTFALLPMFDSVMSARVRLMAPLFFGVHLLYGVVITGVSRPSPE